MNLRFATDPEAVFQTLADPVSINSVNPNYPGGPGKQPLPIIFADFSGRTAFLLRFRRFSKAGPMSLPGWKDDLEAAP